MSTPLLIAHRGGSAEAPENTLAAFRHSLGMGIQWFELDAQMTKDGELLVIHDETLERTTSGSGPVGSFTLEELRRLDAGSWFGTQFSRETIPTLREVLELCASEGAGVFVELKSPHLYPGVEQKVVSLLGELWVQGVSNISCISFDPEAVSRLHELDSGLPLGQLFDLDTTDFAQPDDRIEAVLPFYATAAYYPEQIERAHALGKRVHVWTVNEEADMRRLAELGVDGIMSDRPSLLLKVFDNY